MTGVVLISPLPRAQCVARLNDAIDSSWTVFGSREVIGRVREDSMWLIKRIWYRNSFQTVLRARLDDQGGDTRIECKFGVSRFVLAFAVVWLVLSTSFIMFALQDWKQMLIDVALPLGGAAVVGFGRWLARNERAFLTDFVCRMTDARAEQTPFSS